MGSCDSTRFDEDRGVMAVKLQVSQQRLELKLTLVVSFTYSTHNEKQ